MLFFARHRGENDSLRQSQKNDFSKGFAFVGLLELFPRLQFTFGAFSVNKRTWLVNLMFGKASVSRLCFRYWLRLLNLRSLEARMISSVGNMIS